MRRVTLAVVGLTLLLSLGVGVLVGRMAGGGSEADREFVLSAIAPTMPAQGTPQITGSPARPDSTPAG